MNVFLFTNSSSGRLSTVSCFYRLGNKRTTDFLLSQHATYWTIKDIMGFIVPVPLLNMRCWNRTDLKVSLPIPDLVSSGCLLPDGLLKLPVVPQKAGLILPLKRTLLYDNCLLTLKNSKWEGLEASRSPGHAQAISCAGWWNRSALCTGRNFFS